MTQDIDMDGVTWKPIGDLNLDNYPNLDFATTFRGSFDGNDKKISNLEINSASYCQGLFGAVGPGGIVKNLGLENINIEGADYVGGIAGTNDGGTIENCYATGDVTVNGEGGGGIVGGNSGAIKNCYFVGDVKGYEEVGGIVGSNDDGTIENCYSTANVTGDTTRAGGIVGVHKTSLPQRRSLLQRNDSTSLSNFGSRQHLSV